jgi:sugar phosphate isomerase/epimerase
MRRLSLTSWSLHRSLESGALSLAVLPGRMRAAGIGTLEVCHFHLADVPAALAQGDTLPQLRAALDDAGVELFSLLIDTGDISAADPQRRQADLALIAGWIDVAAALGARCARVVGGEASPDDEAALERATAGLRQLAAHARERGLRVTTENFRALLSTAANCNRVLDALDGAVGLCADIGNFPAASRLAEFSAVVGRAEVVHAKASYDDAGRILADDVRRCLEASVAAGFDGPYTLVYDRPGDSWAGIAELKAVVEPFL